MLVYVSGKDSPWKSGEILERHCLYTCKIRLSVGTVITRHADALKSVKRRILSNSENIFPDSIANARRSFPEGPDIPRFSGDRQPISDMTLLSSEERNDSHSMMVGIHTLIAHRIWSWCCQFIGIPKVNAVFFQNVMDMTKGEDGITFLCPFW